MRRSHDDDAVDWQRLEDGERNVPGSRGHIDVKLIDVAVSDVAPELLHQSADDGSPPNDGGGGVVGQEIQGNRLDSGKGLHGEDLLVGPRGAFFQTEDGGDARPGDIRIHDRDLLAISIRVHGKQRSGQGFADSAFAGDHGDDFFDVAIFVRRDPEVFRLHVLAHKLPQMMETIIPGKSDKSLSNAHALDRIPLSWRGNQGKPHG